MFQSTPAIAGERDHNSPGVVAQEHEFQSTPAIAGERDPTMPMLAPVSLRFNPRPPLLASETRVSSPTRTVAEFQSTPAIAGERDVGSNARLLHRFVSIHARHCWRARRALICL